MAEYKYVTLKELEAEKLVLKTDFDTLKSNILKLESDIAQMKNNLSAVSGAVQVIDRLIQKANNEKDEGFRGMSKSEIDNMIKSEKKKTKGKK
jgi:hypothetical protein|tara:strand:+ start:239 stop:517 length:279 start_codon:yes stop_codon:yes gene_type:complete